MMKKYDITKTHARVQKLCGVKKLYKKVSVGRKVFCQKVFDFHKGIVKVVFQNKK